MARVRKGDKCPVCRKGTVRWQALLPQNYGTVTIVARKYGVCPSCYYKQYEERYGEVFPYIDVPYKDEVKADAGKN